MFGTMKSGANAYARVGVETGVVAADPHQLIVMLFEGAQVALVNGLQHMKNGNVAEKGKAMSSAIMIIENGLRASLDKSVGGEIAMNLDALYGYMSNRLLVANMNNQPEIIEEVQNLLGEIKTAWDQISPSAQAAKEPVVDAYAEEAAASAMPRLMKA
ncbi:MAG TPA: flagellar export chaperone FliS [Oxalicibacterium sp.]|jgi:flagellar protein FliS|nr:flagellar export chaperone FliS [Oxalicibacterium sp.]